MQKMIFIVDDNDANLTLAASSLESGYRVLTMPSAAKMFSLLEKGKIPHLILLDIEMPDMNGLDAAEKLQGQPGWRDIPVLFLTGHTDEAVLAKALALSAGGIIQKPIVPAQLLERVDEFFSS